MTAAWLLLAFSLSPVAQAGVGQDPIHPADRVFTADEFRQKLLLMRSEKKILDLFQDSKIPRDTQEKLLDFARRLRDANQKAEGKKDFSIPPELLQNPAIQEIIENEKLLEWLANNERIQELAIRMAKKLNIDYPSDKRLPSPNPSASPDQGNARPTENNRNLPPTDSSRDRSNPNSEPSKKEELGNSGDQPGAAPTRDESPTGPLEGLTDRLRKIRPLADSPTLDRLDDMLNGSTPASMPDSGAPLPSDQQPPNSISPTLPPPSDNPWLDLWNDLPFVDNAPPSISEIPLPPGLDQWIPSIDGVSIPNLPLPNLDLAGLSAPSLPTIPTSFDPTLSPTGYATPLATLAIVAGLIVLARYLLFAGWLEPNSSNSRSNYRPRPPAHPFNPTDRSSIREWFEFAAFKLLGLRASSMSHADWQKSIDQAYPHSQWPKLYAQARYLPETEPIDPTLAEKAQDELHRLTGK